MTLHETVDIIDNNIIMTLHETVDIIDNNKNMYRLHVHHFVTKFVLLLNELCWFGFH